MSLFPIDSLSIPCPACGESMRSHCTEAEGAWTYHPCLPALRATGLAPDDWWDQVVGCDCAHCGMTVASHFVRPPPGIRISVAFSVPQKGGWNRERHMGDITPPGMVIVRPPTAFRDCRAGS